MDRGVGRTAAFVKADLPHCVAARSVILNACDGRLGRQRRARTSEKVRAPGRAAAGEAPGRRRGGFGHHGKHLSWRGFPARRDAGGSRRGGRDPRAAQRGGGAGRRPGPVGTAEGARRGRRGRGGQPAPFVTGKGKSLALILRSASLSPSARSRKGTRVASSTVIVPGSPSEYCFCSGAIGAPFSHLSRTSRAISSAWTSSGCGGPRFRTSTGGLYGWPELSCIQPIWTWATSAQSACPGGGRLGGLGAQGTRGGKGAGV